MDGKWPFPDPTLQEEIASPARTPSGYCASLLASGLQLSVVNFAALPWEMSTLI